MLDFPFFLTDIFLDVNNRRSVQQFFLMLLSYPTLCPETTLRDVSKIPYTPRVFVGLSATNDPRLLYPRPTTHDYYSHVIQPQKIDAVPVFPVDFNKFVNCFFLYSKRELNCDSVNYKLKIMLFCNRPHASSTRSRPTSTHIDWRLK